MWTVSPAFRRHGSHAPAFRVDTQRGRPRAQSAGVCRLREMLQSADMHWYMQIRYMLRQKLCGLRMPHRLRVQVQLPTGDCMSLTCVEIVVRGARAMRVGVRTLPTP